MEKGDWDFRISDLVKNPDGTVVNFGEVRRAQLSHVQSPHIHVVSPGIYFKMEMGEWDAERKWKLTLL